MIYARNKISHSNNTTITRISTGFDIFSKRSGMGKPTHIRMEIIMAPTMVDIIVVISFFTLPPYALFLMDLILCTTLRVKRRALTLK